MLPVGVITLVTADGKREGEVTVKKFIRRSLHIAYLFTFDKGFDLQIDREEDLLFNNMNVVRGTWVSVLSPEEYETIVNAGRIKMEHIPPLPVPPGQNDPISHELITDGMKMATFNDEYGHRYYQYNTVMEMMDRKLRTVTGESVGKVKAYTAKIEGKTRVKFEGKPYDLVVISPGVYQLEDDSGIVIKKYNDTELDTAPLAYIGGGRRKTRRVKKRRASRRAKTRTRRSRS